MEHLVSLLVDFGIVGIIIAAFSEAVFLPVPMELISIPVYLANPTKAFFYSVILIVFSILGSITGYHLSRLIGKPLIHKFVAEKHIHRLKTLYEKNALWALLTSAFTFIPYEAYVLSAGTFEIGFNKFLFATVISRAIRHLPQGILIWLYGDIILLNLKAYTLAVVLLVFVIIIAFNYLQKKFKMSQ